MRTAAALDYLLETRDLFELNGKLQELGEPTLSSDAAAFELGARELMVLKSLNQILAEAASSDTQSPLRFLDMAHFQVSQPETLAVASAFVAYDRLRFLEAEGISTSDPNLKGRVEAFEKELWKACRDLLPPHLEGVLLVAVPAENEAAARAAKDAFVAELKRPDFAASLKADPSLTEEERSVLKRLNPDWIEPVSWDYSWGLAFGVRPFKERPIDTDTPHPEPIAEHWSEQEVFDPAEVEDAVKKWVSGRPELARLDFVARVYTQVDWARS